MIFCVASAAFSADKDNFAWQAQHLNHVIIKKWHAAVGKSAIVTCFARLKNLNKLFSLREENVMIESARMARWSPVCGAVAILNRNVVPLWRGANSA